MHPEVKQYGARKTTHESNLETNHMKQNLEENDNRIWQNFIVGQTEPPNRNWMLRGERNDFQYSGLQIQYARKYGVSIFDFLMKLQCWPKETLRVLFYEAKVPNSDGHSTM